MQLFSGKKERVNNWIKKQCKNFKQVIEIFKQGLKFKFFNNSRSITIPIILASALILISFIWNKPTPDFNNSLFYNIIFAGIISPITEEILVRGLFFGGLLGLSGILIKNKHFKKIIIFVFLIIQAWFFTINHNNFSNYLYNIRFASGILYGSLYLFNNKSLTSPTIAHITNNLLIVLINLNMF